jgi:predicted acylesterase/phospholipase RssA/CRP-like cAMP-binding protein
MTVEAGSDELAAERRDLLRSTVLFGDLTAEQLDEVLSRCSTRRVSAGEWCVRAGERPDGLYIVIYGRLQTYATNGPGDQISQGQVFGEIGMLTGQPRAAGVQAIRDTELLFLPVAEFDRLAEEHQGWLRRVAQIVVDRLVVPSHHAAEDRVLTIAVVALGHVHAIREVTAAMADSLGVEAKSVFVERGEAPASPHRARWAQRLEDANRYVFYDGTADGDDEWTAWCIRHSDRLVLVADAAVPARPMPPDLSRELPERVRAGTVTLVLLQPSTATRPKVVPDLRRAVGDTPVLNVRRGHAADLARTARLIAGRGVGLVLGGGGPRGFAHLGVMRAFDEAGVPVDAVGGTSIGALMGSFRAIDLDADTREQWVLTGFVESGNLFPPTFPILSFSSAHKVRRLLESEQYLGDRLIEETWIPFFCVSANLTRADVFVHDRGHMATAVRASLSLPGIFPPVRSGPDLLVDGGVLNNLPVDVMRQRLALSAVVAVDLAVAEEVAAPSRYRETPSGWSLLLERVARRDRVDAPPLWLNVLMRAKELAGIRAQRQIMADCPPDLLIRPDVSDASMFDFKGARHLIEVGRRAALVALEADGWATAHASTGPMPVG